MSLIVQCKTCGRELRSQDRYAGMRVRCPQCSTINELPPEPSGAILSTAGLPRAKENRGTPQLVAGDFWEDLSTGEPRMAPLLEPRLRPRHSNAWLYVMMGFAAAVPFVVLLFIVAQLIVHSLESKPQSPPLKQAPAISRPDDGKERQTQDILGRTPQVSGSIGRGHRPV